MSEILVSIPLMVGLLGLLVWVFRPLQRSHQSALPIWLKELQSLYFSKRQLLDNLADLEADRDLQKINEADYQELRARWLTEGSAIYRRIEELETTEPDLLRIKKEVAQ